jgi:hypothetical protein
MFDDTPIAAVAADERAQRYGLLGPGDDGELDARDFDQRDQNTEPRDANGRLIPCPRVARFDAQQPGARPAPERVRLAA